jgi:heptosyltransferase I
VTRLLVVRLGSLGDLVHTLPAVAGIRRAHPTIAIDWLVDAAHKEFLSLVSVIDDVVVLRNRSARAWIEARRLLRRRAYDVALDFQGLIKSAALARLSGAARVIGFDRAALREGAAALFYTERIEVGEGRHVVYKNLRLATSVGVPPDALEFPLAHVESPLLGEIQRRIGGPFALLNCGAAWPNKRWPPHHFGRTAAWLRDRHGMASLVLWGPGESAAAESVVAASDGAATLAPPTGLGDLVALSRAASLMVSGDTGPTHIAAAVGTPVVALFGPTDPARNGPWDTDDRVVSRYEQCGCHYERRCRRADREWCLGTITVDEVTAAIDARLEGPDGRD